MSANLQQPAGFIEALRQAILLWLKGLPQVWLEAAGFSIVSVVPFYLREAGQFSHFVVVSISLVCVLLSLLFANIVYARLQSVWSGQALTRSQAFAAGLLKWPSSIAATIIIVIGMGGLLLVLAILWGALGGQQASAPTGLLIVLLPLVVLASYISCVFPLIMVEKRTAWAAVKGSFQLVHRHWGYATCLWLFAILFAHSLNSAAYHLAKSWGTFIATIFTMPLQVSIFLMIYHQLRLRAEVKTTF